MTSWKKTVFPRPCVTCGEEFQPFNPKQATCTKACFDSNPLLVEARLAAKRARYRRYVADPEVREQRNAANRVSNRPHRRLTYLKSRLLRDYGISYEEYVALVDAQGNRCAICGDPPKPDGKGAYSRLQVDHHHGTGKVRGLLCAPCNKGIGHLCESPERLASALEYLVRHT